MLDDDAILQRVKADLARRYPHSLSRGRHSTPVEAILRLLVVKRLYQWSYSETEHFVGDSLVLRQFCRLYFQPVPDDTTLIRWANLIGPETLQQINDRVVELAKQCKVTRGRKLRVDSTVVETNIHYPTDSALVGDGVRVLSRLLHKAKAALGDTAKVGKAAFRSRTRSVRRIAQELHRVARRKGEAAAEDLKQAYTKLLEIAQASRRQAVRVREALQEQGSKQAQRVREQLDRFLPLVDQALEQARRRVLLGEQVPAGEKLLSLFEPQTQIIRRHKAGKPNEFGRKLWLGEVEGGIIVSIACSSRVGAWIIPRCRRAWRRTSSALAVPRTCWPAIAASFRQTMRRWPASSRSSALCCPGRGGCPRRDRRRNGKAGAGGASGSVRGSKGGSVCSNVTLGWVVAQIMEKKGWSAGWAGGS